MANVKITDLAEVTTLADGSAIELASLSGGVFSSKKTLLSTVADYVVGRLNAALTATPLTVARGGTGDAGTGWTAYSASVTAVTGAYTSATARGRYKRVGKTVFVSVVILITTNGSAAGGPVVGLPFPAVASADNIIAVLAGQTSLDNTMVKGVIVQNASTMTVTRYNNVYPGGDGVTLYLSGSYESA